MRLRVKFSLLVAGLILVTVSINCLMFRIFTRLTALKEYQFTVLQTNSVAQQLFSYNNTVFEENFDSQSISDNWNALYNQTDALIQTLPDFAYADSMFDTDIYDDLREISSKWSYFNSSLKSLTTTREYLYTFVSESFNDAFNDMTAHLNSIYARRYQLFLVAFMAGMTISTILVFVILSVVTGRITTRVNKLKTLSLKLSQKDLRTQIPDTGSDELGELLRDLSNTIGELDEVFKDVKLSAAKVQAFGDNVNEMTDTTAAATSQIKASMSSLRKQFASLYQSVDESMKKLKEMSDVALSLVVDNQQQADSISTNASDVTAITRTIRNIAGTSVKKTQSAEQIQEFVADGDSKISATADLLSEVTDQLDEIGEVVDIIDNIADQTNTLSMNAAIESAHAGDAGRGFSVVAEEIRNLAESTADNARHISKLINGVINKVKAADEASAEAATAFARVSEHASDMVSSLKEITREIGDVGVGIGNIDDRTQNIASTARKISSECDTLNLHQMDVSEAMSQMHNIFYEVREGVDEIQKGADDIVERSLAVSEMSTENAKGIQALTVSLERFRTTGSEVMFASELRKIRNGKYDVVMPEEIAAKEPEPLESGSSEDAPFDAAIDEDNPFGLAEAKKEEPHEVFDSEPDDESKLCDYFLS